MKFQIEPDLEYRIRSRGIEKSPVPGNRLPQMVRDLLVARHDELSIDGVVWFSAGDVESLFPSSGAANLVRQRQVFEAHEVATDPHASVDIDDGRTFPRDPWYVARGSNVAGPYDQLTIVDWYEQGCLVDKDQLRPGLHASWRSMADARKEGLMNPPPANSVSSNAKYLVADPPVWMGPPRSVTPAGTFAPIIASDSGRPGNRPIIVVALAGCLLIAVLTGLAGVGVAIVLAFLAS